MRRVVEAGDEAWLIQVACGAAQRPAAASSIMVLVLAIDQIDVFIIMTSWVIGLHRHWGMGYERVHVGVGLSSRDLVWSRNH